MGELIIVDLPSPAGGGNNGGNNDNDFGVGLDLAPSSPPCVK